MSLLRPLRAPAAALAAAVALAGAAAAAAEERTLVLDPDETRITFRLPAFLHTVEGSFRLASGEVRFDPANGAAAGRIEVDVASGTTDNRRRDRRMHAEVLLSERFPRFVFVPDHFEGSVGPAGGGVMLGGELEFFGARHRIEIPAWVEPDRDGRVRAGGTFTVPYAAWGMKDVSAFLLRVADEVEVRIELVGEYAPEAAEPALAEPAPAEPAPAGNAPPAPARAPRKSS